MNSQVDPGFGLTIGQLKDILLNHCLKPEEISGSAEKQHDRVDELINWFARLSQGMANPKWTEKHAFELVYYIATTDPSRHLDLRALRQRAFGDGVKLPDEQRRLILGNKAGEKFGAPT